ncbi:MAG: HEAT repeat domain-containing protein [Planctomycetes bacterium]|nr:HEAT repeat domain-containing protein [Planctomycetota bacterium]
MLAALVACLFAAQEPQPAPTPAPPANKPAAAAPAPTVLVEAWDDKKAKAAIAEWTKLAKGNASMAEKSRGLNALAEGSNKLLVKPLATVVETDKSVVIRRRAAELLANQPKVDANPTIRSLLKNSKVAPHPTVMAELVKTLSRCGYSTAQWGEIDGLFDGEYHLDRVVVQEAILELVIAHKEAQALPTLLRNMDEPLAENVDGANNPPAEYWEARWKSWHAWRGKVKDALFAVTGQRFSSAAEATAWLKKNAPK